MRRALAAAAFALLAASPALASFHLIYVVEVFTGTDAAPNAQYIVLQAYAPGQNFLTGHSLTVFDTDGSPIPNGTFTFGSGVANASDQMTVLLATPSAQTFFNVSADMTILPILPAGGGKVCWNALTPMCVAWGGYSGPMTGVGTPVNAPVGIPPGRSIHRRLDICGLPTNLDSCDDTQNSANDFLLGAPTPKNNLGTLGSIPAANCGNLSLEGLEGCDDGNTASSDGCSSACLIETGAFSAQALAVDPTATGSSDGNGVLEPGETAWVVPSWKNVKTSTLPLRGFVSSWTSGVAASYSSPAAEARYGNLASNATGTCTPGTGFCPQVGISFSGARPQTHVDVPFVEVLTNGDIHTWPVHVGGSFTDVPKTLPFYKFIETLLHDGVTGGCGGSMFCPTNNVTRAQMSVFLLVSKDGSSYVPPPCVTPTFGDVPCSNGFAKWIQELVTRGITAGCGGGNFCPNDPVNRAQMAVFLIATAQPGFTPPACTTPPFADVPCSSPFAKWIQELVTRGITAGCGGGNFCPSNPVTRQQMAVFLTTTFGLKLYGP